MDKHLHVIAFDIPYPANYGGVIDVYYKLKALKELGVKIHLHVYEYGREKTKKLNELCVSVDYYNRRTTRNYLFHKKPYIVASRNSDKLLKNLKSKPFPILFEGLHTCYYLNHKDIADRRKVVRSHNIEHDYYRSLAKVERNVFKKMYFQREADKLERFEYEMIHADGIAGISQKDSKYLSRKFKTVKHISAFHAHEVVEAPEGRGDYCLYHGSLDVGENNEAAIFLVKKVFSKLQHNLIIAGKKPSKELVELVNSAPNVLLKTKEDTDGIHSLIRNAQVNILPTFQATGLKLKLLAALYLGRHCLVNTPMVESTGLESLCRVEDADKGLRKAVNELMETELTASDYQHRSELLNTGFGNLENAKNLYQLIFEEASTMAEKEPEVVNIGK